MGTTMRQGSPFPPRMSDFIDRTHRVSRGSNSPFRTLNCDLEWLRGAIAEVVGNTAAPGGVAMQQSYGTIKPDQFLRALVASSDDPIIGKTLDGTIISWNEAAQRLYGFAPWEILGQNVSVLVPADR